MTGAVADATTSTIIVLQVEYWTAAGQVEPGLIQLIYPWTVGQSQSAQSETTTPAHKWLRIVSGHIVQFGGIPSAVAPTTLTAAFNCPYVSAGAWLPYPMEAPLAFTDSVEPYRWARVNASTLIASNATAVLNKEGTVLAGRLATTTVWPWAATEANLHAIPPQLRYFRPLESGFRTYTLPPTQNGSFIDTYGMWGSNAVPLYPLELNCMFTLLALTDPGTTTASSLAISYHQHREFVPTTQLFPVGVSRFSIDQFVRLLQQATLYPPVLANRALAFSTGAEMRPPRVRTAPKVKKTVKANKKRQERAQMIQQKRGTRQPRGQSWVKPQQQKQPPQSNQQKTTQPGKMRGGLDIYLERRAKGRE